VTQTLQDIIGHEPFHWRGDRDGLEQFNGTFTNLQGAATALTTTELQEFKDFLATITFPPNPFRTFNNSLSTNLALPGHFALGRGARQAGQQLPDGNAQTGLNRFRQQGTSGCTHCHTLPVGVGPDLIWNGLAWRQFPIGTNGQRHTAMIALERSSFLPFKIAQLRSLQDKIGMDLQNASSMSGFGFFHDGSVDSLVRFLQDGFGFRDDKESADMIAFLLSFTGSDLPAGLINDPDRPPGSPGKDVAAAVGRQTTITDTAPVRLIDDMILLANSATSRVDLVVRGEMDGLQRGWVLNRGPVRFQSDRNGETMTTSQLSLLANTNNPLTYTLVPRGAGFRIGVDRDEDGFFDRTEIEYGSDPLDPISRATNTPPIVSTIADTSVAAGSLLSLIVAATDNDKPAQTLSFTLDPPRPAGADIDHASGLLTWKPTQSQALSAYTIAVHVSDDGIPPRSTTTSFSVTVRQHPLAPAMGTVTVGTNGVTIQWVAIVGRSYKVQFKDSLADPAWTDLGNELSANSFEMSFQDATAHLRDERYYRVLLIE
jgi:hypothetical protein